jgi:PKD repeat protein
VAYSIPSGASRTSPSSPWIAAINVPVTFQALETHGTYSWDFGDGTTSTDNPATHTFTTNGNISVKLTVTGDGTNTSGTASATIHLTVTDPYTLHLTNDRFTVTADWATGSGASATSGHGTATSLTADTGYFWFFSSSNTEVIVKVLDACSIGGHFWVFASGLTNLGVNLTVTDTLKGATKSYVNPDGTAFAPVQDFGTFVCSSP